MNLPYFQWLCPEGNGGPHNYNREMPGEEDLKCHEGRDRECVMLCNQDCLEIAPLLCPYPP